MTDVAEPTPRRGMTFPFFLTVLIFAAVMADTYLGEPGFVASSAYRANGYVFVGVVLAAFLLWLWVLAAARRRSSHFDGPILTTRGSNGALQAEHPVGAEDVGPAERGCRERGLEFGLVDPVRLGAQGVGLELVVAHGRSPPRARTGRRGVRGLQTARSASAGQGAEHRPNGPEPLPVRAFHSVTGRFQSVGERRLSAR